MIWNFDKGEPLKTMLPALWIVGKLDLAHHRDRNDNQNIELRKVCKGDVCAIYVDNNNCPVLLTFCLFRYFPGTRVQERQEGRILAR